MDAGHAAGLGPGWRVLGAIGCISYAALAIVAGLDREALDDLQRPAVLDWPYAVAAQFAATKTAIAQHDAPQAVAHAVTLVRHDPMESRAISLLGLALGDAHQLDQANSAFALAARLGWRDPVTQRYWFAQFLRAGDVRHAALRLDALLRQTPDLPDGKALLRAMLVYNEGRDAIAERLKGNPGWSGQFVSQLAGLDEDDLVARADVVERTGPGHWQCNDIPELITASLARGLFDEARTVHRTVCGGADGLINDGDFNHLSSGVGISMLDWNLTGRGDMVILVNPAPLYGHMLSMSLSAPSTVMAVRQMTVAGPGDYRLTWRMPDTSPAQANGFLVSFDCTGDQAAAINGTRQAGSDPLYEARFVVPANCPVPTLRFWLLPNQPVNVANVRLSRVTG